jgi:GNAT superfamily N-acetyltransferase
MMLCERPPVAESLLDFIVFREFEASSDYNCVLSNWSHSFKGSPWAGVCPNNLWHAQMKQTLDQLLSRGAQVIMAVADDDPDQIVGWVCYEKSKSGVSVVHYVFVKDDDFRGHGIASALLDIARQGDFIYTFRTPDGKHLEKRGTHVPAIGRRKNLEPIYATKTKRG